MRHLKLPLVVVAGAAALMLAIRLAAASWMWAGVLSADKGPFYRYLWLESLGDVALWIAAAGAMAWLHRRAAEAEGGRTRYEHLSEMALLSGGLAHEIRNHLNALGTYISLLRKSAPAPNDAWLAQVEKLEQVLTELDELVTDFLTLARPVKDKLEQVDLAKLAAEVREFLTLDFEQSHVDVRLETARGVPPVIGDRGKLRRAILNLLVNARQAMPEGGTITLRLRSSGSQVQLDVEDTGCGIPPEEQPRIFQPFFSTKAEGTGLGLAVVKRTIEDLGGHVGFESEVGRGTTFHVVLPSAEQYDAAMRRLGRPRQEEILPATR